MGGGWKVLHSVSDFNGTIRHSHTGIVLVNPTLTSVNKLTEVLCHLCYLNLQTPVFLTKRKHMREMLIIKFKRRNGVASVREEAESNKSKRNNREIAREPDDIKEEKRKMQVKRKLTPSSKRQTSKIIKKEVGEGFTSWSYEAS